MARDELLERLEATIDLSAGRMPVAITVASDEKARAAAYVASKGRRGAAVEVLTEAEFAAQRAAAERRIAEAAAGIAGNS